MELFKLLHLETPLPYGHLGPSLTCKGVGAVGLQLKNFLVLKYIYFIIQEMQANSFIMLTAGYETTSTTLALAAHELAINPDIQKKLQEEIDEHFPDKVEFFPESDGDIVYNVAYCVSSLFTFRRLFSHFRIASRTI